LDGTRINVELALAKVFPFQKACHSVPVQDGYVVVQPSYVWATAGHYLLPVPIDGGDIATLVEALIPRIQWPKDRILIPPTTRHPNLEAATGSRGTTSGGGTTAQCQQEKAQQHQHINKTTSRSIDHSWKSPDKLRLSSSCNTRISNRRNNNLSCSRSIDNSQRSPGK
jgi:hypothetical protein